jgi:tetrahydromethanopterin S-methyltransferase subunit G
MATVDEGIEYKLDMGRKMWDKPGAFTIWTQGTNYPFRSVPNFPVERKNFRGDVTIDFSTTYTPHRKKKDLNSLDRRVSDLENKVDNKFMDKLWTNKDMWAAIGIGFIIGMVIGIATVGMVTA